MTDRDLYPLPRFARTICISSDSIDIVEAFVAHSQLTRENGLLALEDFIDDIPDLIARKLLQLTVNGTEPEKEKQIADYSIESELHRLEAYLKAVRQAVNSIQSVDRPRIIRELLLSIYGIRNLDDKKFATSARNRCIEILFGRPV